MERRSYRFGGGVDCAADKAVRIARRYHERRGVEWFPSDFARFDFGDAFGAAAFKVKPRIFSYVLLRYHAIGSKQDGGQQILAQQALGRSLDSRVAAFW